jgi:hypothetical protein
VTHYPYFAHSDTCILKAIQNHSIARPWLQFALALLYLAHHSLSAQHINNLVVSLHDHKEFIVGIDNRITLINDKFAVIYGLYSGVGYGENLRVKFSISGTPFETGKISQQNASSQLSRLLFASIGQEFDFLTAGKFKVATYLNAGYGLHFQRSVNYREEQIEKEIETMFPLELGLHGRYQINPLIAFKTGGGYRFVFPDDASDLSGYYIKLTFVVNPKKLKTYLRDRKDRRSRPPEG